MLKINKCSFKIHTCQCSVFRGLSRRCCSVDSQFSSYCNGCRCNYCRGRRCRSGSSRCRSCWTFRCLC